MVKSTHLIPKYLKNEAGLPFGHPKAKGDSVKTKLEQLGCVVTQSTLGGYFEVQLPQGWTEHEPEKSGDTLSQYYCDPSGRWKIAVYHDESGDYDPDGWQENWVEFNEDVEA